MITVLTSWNASARRPMPFLLIHIHHVPHIPLHLLFSRNRSDAPHSCRQGIQFVIRNIPFPRHLSHAIPHHFKCLGLELRCHVRPINIRNLRRPPPATRALLISAFVKKRRVANPYIRSAEGPIIRHQPSELAGGHLPPSWFLRHHARLPLPRTLARKRGVRGEHQPPILAPPAQKDPPTWTQKPSGRQSNLCRK